MKKTILKLVLLGICSASHATPFSIVCSELHLGAGRTINSPYKVSWDGYQLSNETDPSGHIGRSNQSVLSLKKLEHWKPGGMKYSFLTGVHAKKQYKYYTTVEASSDKGNDQDLVVLFATIDPDGYLVHASSFEYKKCQIF